jgi:hypothetical protein
MRQPKRWEGLGFAEKSACSTDTSKRVSPPSLGTFERSSNWKTSHEVAISAGPAASAPAWMKRSALRGEVPSGERVHDAGSPERTPNESGAPAGSGSSSGAPAGRSTAIGWFIHPAAVDRVLYDQTTEERMAPMTRLAAIWRMDRSGEGKSRSIRSFSEAVSGGVADWGEVE